MSELPTRAISLWAPWAWAILHAGKDVENRGLGFPKVTGPVWIHASLWPGTRKPLNAAQQHELRDEFRAMVQKSGRDREQIKPCTLGEIDSWRGKIVGSVTITGHVRYSKSVWFVPESLGLTLADAKALHEPVAAVGAQGVWTVPGHILADLESASFKRVTP